jgi:hypothetical protein
VANKAISVVMRCRFDAINDIGGPDGHRRIKVHKRRSGGRPSGALNGHQAAAARARSRPTTAINPSGIVRKRLETEAENSFGRRRQTTSSSFGPPRTKREMMNSLAALCDVNFDECFPALLI